jgi:hypothetical protein
MDIYRFLIINGKKVGERSEVATETADLSMNPYPL